MKKNTGMTLIGTLFAATSTIIMGALLLKIVPVYIENYSISEAITNFNKSSIAPGDVETQKRYLKEKITTQLEMNGVYDVKPEQIIVAETSGDMYRVTIDYTVTKSLIGNLSLLFTFHETNEVSLAAQ